MADENTTGPGRKKRPVFVESPVQAGMNSEQRADLAIRGLRAIAIRDGSWSTLPAETAISDALANIAHLCDRLGIDAGTLFDHALNVHQGDLTEDRPATITVVPLRPERAAEVGDGALSDYFEHWELAGPAAEPDPAETELVIRDPDHALEIYGGVNIKVIEIDLGGEFDSEHAFALLGAERCNEILDDWREHRSAFPAGSQALEVLERLIAEYEKAATEEWGAEINPTRDQEQASGAAPAAKVTVLERAQKVVDRINSGALPSEAVAAEGFGEDEVYSEDGSVFELDDPDNDLIDFGRMPAGETVLLKRSLGDRETWVLEQRVEQQANKVETMTEPERKEYNGWATYETWAAGMYLDGNYDGEGTYREVQETVTRLTRGLDDSSTVNEILAARDELASELEKVIHFEVEILTVGEKLEKELLTHALGEINWRELADGQLSGVEIEVPKAERASAEFEPNTTPSATSLVNKALSGHYGGPGVVAQSQQRVRHAAAQDSEYPAVRAADALKEYIEEIRELEGGGSLTDDLVGAQLNDVDWLALAKQRLPEPPAPAGSESPTCRPPRDTGPGPEPEIGR
jgi:hypothetical protein